VFIAIPVLHRGPRGVLEDIEANLGSYRGSSYKVGGSKKAPDARDWLEWCWFPASARNYQVCTGDLGSGGQKNGPVDGH